METQAKIQDICLIQRRNYRGNLWQRNICTHDQNPQTCNRVKDKKKLFPNFTFNQLEYTDNWYKNMLKITLLKTSFVSWLALNL